MSDAPIRLGSHSGSRSSERRSLLARLALWALLSRLTIELRGPTPFLLFIGACLAWVAVRTWSTSRRRVHSLPDALLILEGHREVRIGDAQLRGIGIDIRSAFRDSQVTGTRQTIVIEYDPDKRNPADIGLATESLEYGWKLGQRDPLADWLPRAAHSICHLAAGARDAGETIAGQHWTLTGDELRVTTDGTTAASAWLDVERIEVERGTWAAFHRGSSHAFARWPVTGVNAFVPEWLIRQRVADATGLPRLPTDDPLGHVLLPVPAHGWPLRALLCVVAGWTLLGWFAPLARGWLVLGSDLLMLLGWCVLLTRRDVHFCEWGVAQSGAFPRRLRYDETQAFTVRSAAGLAHMLGGTQREPSVTFQLSARRGRFMTGVTARLAGWSVPTLERLRDHIGRQVGEPWLAALQGGAEVRWTRHLTLAPTGLLVRRPRFLRRAKLRTAPYSSIESYQLTLSHFRLWMAGRPSPIASERTDSPSFYPGLWVFLSRFAPGQAPDASGALAPATGLPTRRAPRQMEIQSVDFDEF